MDHQTFQMQSTHGKHGFGMRLDQLLKDRQLSQARLARVLGVSKNSVNNWVKGRSTPDAFHAVALAAQLKTSVETLVGGSGDSRLAGDPILQRLADPELGRVIAEIAGAAPELRDLAAEARRRVTT